MDTQNPSAPSRARSAIGGDKPPSRATALPRGRAHPTAARPQASGIAHENTRHTSRFTVIGNHLTQHQELSLLAIGLACHIQSLPAGARADIKTLVARFPEGSTRIAAALRELEAHGYLRRDRERTPAGRIVTRTTSCNQPSAPRRHAPTPKPCASGQVSSAEPQSAELQPGAAPPVRAPQKLPHPLPAVPHPAYPAPALLQQATDLLIALRHHDPRLLLTTQDAAHLAPGVAAWLERDVAPTAVRHALTTALPPEGPRHPAALLAHLLTALLPPPFPHPTRHPLQNCDTCDRAYRALEPGHCRDCRVPPYAD
ncbi:helix-turn-helix domain-containing protein [Streptomyces sp. Je 1-369]|uniref:helix-turn-helix domain-containing protein n=1 Tax=Streptomyces sp. Je 1-369 TaxID=2966192 RepID=UPI0022859CD8|nr:helix-turn-helix domain-containing protein [Streptomyces sp. Je 1-369]WAL97310.1 helix-turn-helix domain-containing protein [Streptomyces sp. Je 1-369]